MFWLAGRAVSNARNHNWADYYRRSAGWAVPLMTGLRQLRVLGTVALVVRALEALLLEYRAAWEQLVPVPAAWFTTLEQFYRATR